MQYTEDAIIADYMYDTSVVETSPDGQMLVRPQQELIKIKTDIKVPRTGVMMVGWGGNNGTTVTAAILANRHNISYRNKHGIVVSSQKLLFFIFGFSFRMLFVLVNCLHSTFLFLFTPTST